MKIAICFFGLNRSSGITEESLLSKLITPMMSLAKIDIFGAFMEPKNPITNNRSGELNQNISRTEFRHIKFRAISYIDQEKFDDEIALDLFLQGTQDVYNDNFASIKNIFRSLFCLSNAYEIAITDSNYDYFIFVRPDLFFIDEVNPHKYLKNLNGQVENLVITPGWQQWGGLNDRYAICDSLGAKTYAKRFYEIPEYLEKTNESLHSESFLLWSLIKGESVWNNFSNERAIRVRSNGVFSKEEFQQSGISSDVLLRYQNILNAKKWVPIKTDGHEAFVTIEKDRCFKIYKDSYKDFDKEYHRYGEVKFLNEYNSKYFPKIILHNDNGFIMDNHGVSIGMRDPLNFKNRKLNKSIKYDRIQLLTWIHDLKIYLLANGLMHRDINPLNITYSYKDNDFKLLDFSWSSPEDHIFSKSLPLTLNPYGKSDFKSLSRLEHEVRDLWASELCYYVMIVWDKGRDLLDEVRKHIESEFELLLCCDFEWPIELFSKNLSSFYGENLPKNCKKENDIGVGAFYSFVFVDNRPDFAVVDIRGSKQIVNLNVFNYKSKIRNRKGVYRNTIHCSNSPKEGNSDFENLLGSECLSALSMRNQTISISHKLLNWDTKRGWHSINDLFKALEQNVNYVVLRNFQKLPDIYTSGTHGDIDLLVSDLLKSLLISRAIYVKNSVHYKIKINYEYVYFDFRSVDDSYYCNQWSIDILNRREQLNGFYTPCLNDYFYSLLYHAIIHKPKIAVDYVEVLMELSNCLSFNVNSFEDLPPMLFDFLRNHNYAFCKPNDQTVHYNKSNTSINTMKLIFSKQ